MADTIREQIIGKYITRLASWLVSGGFNYNCGRSVFRARIPYDLKEMPLCALWPQPETAQNGRHGYVICDMPVKLEALVSVEAGVNNSVIQEQLLGDAIKIMTDPGVIVTSLIENIRYTDGGPAGVAKGEEQTTAISAEFLIKYKTKLGNPYSQ